MLERRMNCCHCCTTNFVNYALSVYATDPEILSEAKSINEKCKQRTGFLNTEKKQFYDRLGKAIMSLSRNFHNFEKKAGGKDILAHKTHTADHNTTEGRIIKSLQYAGR